MAGEENSMEDKDNKEPDIFEGLRSGKSSVEEKDTMEPDIFEGLRSGKSSMEKKDTMELDIFGGLRNIVGIECKGCGNINPSTAMKCEECGAPLEAKKDDDRTVSVVHREGIPGAHGQRKVAAEDAKYLLLLRDSVEKIMKKAMTFEEYQNNVKIVLTVARVGVELFNTEIMQERVARLPEEQQALVHKTAALFADYSLGCTTMLHYDGSSNFSQAKRGLEMVTKALTEMDRIQDRALEIEAAEKEAKWAEESKSKEKE
jgi:hypothetical protein